MDADEVNGDLLGRILSGMRLLQGDDGSLIRLTLFPDGSGDITSVFDGQTVEIFTFFGIQDLIEQLDRCIMNP